MINEQSSSLLIPCRTNSVIMLRRSLPGRKRITILMDEGGQAEK